MEIMEAMYTLDLVSQRQQASPLNIDEKDGFLRDEWQRIELVQKIINSIWIIINIGSSFFKL